MFIALFLFILFFFQSIVNAYGLYWCPIKILIIYEYINLMHIYDSYLSSAVVILQVTEAGDLQAPPHMT